MVLYEAGINIKMSYYLHYLKNLLFREPLFIMKYYLHFHLKRGEDGLFFMCDGKMLHGGLFDRIKGAISIYAVSKVIGKKFGIYFVSPFLLEKYLVPNLYDWRLNNYDLVYSYPFSRPIIAYSEYKNPQRLFKKQGGQFHYYYSWEILDYVNQKYGTSYDWVSLYNELFTPSEYLLKHVSQEETLIGPDYFAVHLRFMNLLGDKVENDKDTKLKEKGKKKLINACVKKIRDLCSSMKNRAVVFSDSMVFLQEVKKELPEVYIVSGKAKHIGTADNTTDDENLKLFTDMYLMVDAKKVYSIVGKRLYPSAFPEYSAKIGGKPFERLSL